LTKVFGPNFYPWISLFKNKQTNVYLIILD
jgi:hypothetical protein